MKYALMFLLLSQYFVLHSQSMFKAVVISSESGLPLQNVNVYLKPSYVGVVTNDEGAFKIYIDNTQVGDSLILSHLGFKDIILSVNPETVLDDTITMKPYSIELEEIIITGKEVSNILSSCVANFNYNMVSPDMEGELVQKAYLDNKLIKLFVSKFYLEQKNRKVKLFIDKNNMVNKTSCSDLYKYNTLASIESQLLRFLKTKRILQTIIENLNILFEKKTVYESKYSGSDVYIINLEKDLGSGKTSNIKFVIEKSSYALIEIEVWGDRGIGNEKVSNVELEGVVIANRIPIYSSGKISFRKNKDSKWILSKVGATLAVNYMENPNSNKANLRTNDNEILLYFNNICTKNCRRGFEKINPKRDIFLQIGDKKTHNDDERKINYKLTKEEVEFINE